MTNLPEPECELGYTLPQLQAILGCQLDDFNKWFRGQTGAICEGRRYSHEKKQYFPTNCGPHGMVVYRWDLQRFLENKAPLD